MQDLDLRHRLLALSFVLGTRRRKVPFLESVGSGVSVVSRFRLRYFSSTSIRAGHV
jgi:hypothetical protein